ncbi:MAG: hypothetical protein PHN16_03155, partial [Candidatus Omnitrophica bacterium]|nr:hypothetical protein [Candidatus Omnitrophota bacterium]
RRAGMFLLMGLLFLSISSVRAETIILKSGNSIEGKVLEKTDSDIKIEFQSAPLIYSLDEVESIDGVKIVPPGPGREAAGPAAETGRPVIKVDYDHLMSERRDGPPPQKYKLPECDSFVIDATGYSFDNPPNLIMVVVGKEYKYAIAWRPGVTIYTVSKDTLSSLKDSKPFPGFKVGQDVVIMIGNLNMSTKDFFPSWYCLVDIEK